MSRKKSTYLNYKRGEGIPVSWQYPRTPGDINPYLITLKKANTENDYKRNEKTVSWPLKKKATKSYETCNSRKEESYIAAIRRLHMLDTPCNSNLELNMSTTKEDNTKQGSHFLGNRKEYRSQEKIHAAHCKAYNNQRKHYNCCSRSFIKRLHMLDTPCNSNEEWYKSLQKEADTRQEPQLVSDRKEYRTFKKMHPARCKECEDEKKNHNYYRRLSKEFQKVKSEIEELKHFLLSIKNDCSQCANKKKGELKNNKRNNKYKRIKT